MLVLLSPAKTLDFSIIPNEIPNSKPFFAEEASELITKLKQYSADDIAKLMSLSNKLAKLNYQRFQDFNKNAPFKQAIYAYKGDVYEGFELDKYNKSEIDFANSTLRIISGLYGILKPLDLIQPYRLEMSINLPNSSGKNLYDFWDDKITLYLNKEKADVIVNLASQEYFSAIIANKLNKPLVNIAFKEKQGDSYKIVGIHAKKARGMMANFIVQNSIKSVEDLKKYKLNNYNYASELSSTFEYIFVR